MTATMLPPTDFVFQDAIPDDTVPITSDVEYACEVCGRESGPYSGRGRKPTRCAEHKKSRGKTANVGRVTGTSASLAAQASNVLEQLNSIVAVGAMVLGFTNTAQAIYMANGNFKEQAYNALTTDPEFCKFILKGGVTSAKTALGIAYFGMGAQVLPIAVMEYKERKAARMAEMSDENDSGT